MHTALLTANGTMFHEYAICDNQTVVHRLRSDPREAQAVARVFDLVVHCATSTRAEFPFAVVHNEDHTASLCGPKSCDLHWGPILSGPVAMLDALLPDLLTAFATAQRSVS